MYHNLSEKVKANPNPSATEMEDSSSSQSKNTTGRGKKSAAVDAPAKTARQTKAKSSSSPVKKPAATRKGRQPKMAEESREEANDSNYFTIINLVPAYPSFFFLPHFSRAQVSW